MAGEEAREIRGVLDTHRITDLRHRKVGVEQQAPCLQQPPVIGAIGLSEMSAATMRRAHAVHPITAIQTEYSPCVRNAEVGVFDACAELGIGFVAFSPVCRGLLAGAITAQNYAPGDLRLGLPRFTEPNLADNLQLVARFNQVAADAGITPGQLALGWVLAQHNFIVALPGTGSMAHLDENVAAVTASLSDGTLAEVNAIFTSGAMAGSRYLPEIQAQVDTELLPEEMAHIDLAVAKNVAESVVSVQRSVQGR